MALRDDIKDIDEHISVINEELGVIKNELKWHRWLLFACFGLLMGLFGLRVGQPAPFVAGGLAVILYGVK